MPVKIFQPSQHKEEIKQLLRDGRSAEECATRFPLTERTIYRYLREVQDEQRSPLPLSDIDLLLKRVEENMTIVQELKKVNKVLNSQLVHYATKIVELQNLLAADTRNSH